MRISDWSSDVCSSDLGAGAAGGCAVRFEAIRRRVERSEQLVDGRALQTGVRADALKSTWRESWTPARIIIAGLATGFLAGRADPARILKQLGSGGRRSEEPTSELPSPMRNPSARF